MDIKLYSDNYTVVKILKPTKAKFFKDIKVGDLLQFTTTLSHRGSSSNGSPYASYFTAYNYRNKDSITISQSEMVNRLGHFILE